MLRVVAIHRYLRPDAPPYAWLLPRIAAHWARAGHQVQVWGAQPSYRVGLAAQPRSEVLDGVRVTRLWTLPERWRRIGGAFNVAWFPAVVALRILLGRRCDVVMCSTMPPVILGAAVSVAARLRGARFVYHCMDLHPEAGRLAGSFATPWVFRALSWLELGTCRRADRIVVLSEDMRDSMLRRDPKLRDKVTVIPNFELETDSPYEPDAPLPRHGDRTRIVFTGNIGRFQGLEPLVRLMTDPTWDLDHVELVLMGDGAARSRLEGIVRSAPPQVRERVVFLGPSSVSTAKALMGSADLGLVSLDAGVVRYACPSKTATYLEAGLPVLVNAERDSDLVTTLLREDVGLRLPMEDPASAVRVLAGLRSGSPDLDAMGGRARRYWETNLSAARLLPAWSALATSVGAPQSEAPGV